MGFNCGIVGLPNVGKSALFNALTATQAAEATKYPFSTREANVGRVAVPDERLEVCARLAKSAKIVPTQLEFVDIAGLVRGASKGQGLGNQFLGHLREVDAIAHILRCFDDDNVVHVEGSVDPIRDAETVETELMLADLDSLERRMIAVQKRVRGGEREAKAQLDVIEPVLAGLQDGRPARSIALAPEQQGQLKLLQLLTAKPVLYIANIDEGAAATGTEISRRVADYAASQGAQAVMISAAIEAELALIADLDRAARISRRARSRRDRARPGDPRRLFALGPDHLFHRRPQRIQGLDDPPRHQGATGRRGHPYRFREGLHPRRDHPLRRVSSPAAASRAPRMPERCGSKAPITSSRTATSCISASMCEAAPT